ncbi:alpha/beta hydrolase [Litoreibacter roseus]|nr:alpha/beta hydrolase [Litoreibacter roseus]
MTAAAPPIHVTGWRPRSEWYGIATATRVSDRAFHGGMACDGNPHANRDIAPPPPTTAWRALALIAPDIDISAFRQQVTRIGKQPDLTLVIVSQADRALQVSACLSGRLNGWET